MRMIEQMGLVQTEVQLVKFTALGDYLFYNGYPLSTMVYLRLFKRTKKY